MWARSALGRRSWGMGFHCCSSSGRRVSLIPALGQVLALRTWRSHADGRLAPGRHRPDGDPGAGDRVAAGVDTPSRLVAMVVSIGRDQCPGGSVSRPLPWPRKPSSVRWPMAVMIRSAVQVHQGAGPRRTAGRSVPPRRRPGCSPSALMPLALPPSADDVVQNALAVDELDALLQSPRSISQGLAGHCFLGRLQHDHGDLGWRPCASAVRAASMATLPPPTTTTLSPPGTWARPGWHCLAGSPGRLMMPVRCPRWGTPSLKLAGAPTPRYTAS